MTKIATVEPIPVSYPEPNDFNALRHLCLVKITTDDGVVGWGESITQFPEANFAVKAIIEGMARTGGRQGPAGERRHLALPARQGVVVRLWRRHRELRRRGHRHGAVGHQGQAAGHQRAQPHRWRRPREAARHRVLPRPLRGHRGDGRGGPGVGRARPPRRQGGLWQARRRASGLRARPGRGVHAPDARGPRRQGVAHDRLRLERQVGRDDRGPPRPGVRGVRPDLDRGAALGAWDPEGYANLRGKTTSLIAYGEKEWNIDGFERVLATGTVDVVGIDPGRAEGITGFKRAAERIEFYRRQANAHAWSSAICSAVEPGHQLQLAGVQAVRVQAPAQPDAA